MYAGCVYWPFHWSPKTGGIIAGVVVVLGLIDFAVKIARHVKGGGS